VWHQQLENWQRGVVNGDFPASLGCISETLPLFSRDQATFSDNSLIGWHHHCVEMFVNDYFKLMLKARGKELIVEGNFDLPTREEDKGISTCLVAVIGLELVLKGQVSKTKVLSHNFADFKEFSLGHRFTAK
jgi:hypothetical protein